jgi:chromatin segregation and condensation protein Rec8/ScpA/Scc1 (kleisin family)
MEGTIKLLLHSMPEEKPLSEVSIKKVMSLEEMMHNLTEKITNAGTLSFGHIAKHKDAESEKEAKIYAIVSFLAMLELVRNGIIDVLQSDLFSEMSINKV